jgi:hypothetical protein
MGLAKYLISPERLANLRKQRTWPSKHAADHFLAGSHGFGRARQSCPASSDSRYGGAGLSDAIVGDGETRRGPLG